MMRGNRVTRVLGILILLVWGIPVRAQTSSDKAWKEAIEAARKEGKVVVAGSPDPVMRNEIIPKFKARFDIPVEFIAGRSSQIVSRVQTERSAGIYSIDVYLAGPDTTADELYGDKMIDPLKPMLVMPEVVDGTKWKTGKVWFVDPEEQFVVRPFNSVATLLFMNTEYVKPEEIHSIKDLLNPKWRGKISSEDPTTTGAGSNMAARIYQQLGEEFVKSLYIDQKVQRTRDRRQMSDWLARGTAPICLNCRQDDVRPLIKDGFKILEVFELAGISSNVNGSPWLLSVGNKAPHPRAAQVFANWILSKEGLETYARGYDSATLRTDVDESFLNPGNIPKKGVKYFDDTDWKWIVTGRLEYREKVSKLLKSR